jgi:hypothetical protein
MNTELTEMTKKELVHTAIKIGVLPTYLQSLRKEHIIHLIEERSN